MTRKYQRSRPHNKLTPEKLRQLQIMVEGGIPQKLIAKTFGLSRVHIWRLTKKYGYKPSAKTAEEG